MYINKKSLSLNTLQGIKIGLSFPIYLKFILLNNLYDYQHEGGCDKSKILSMSVF